MENLKITISKNGEIIVNFGELDERRLKNYIELFEEVIGPVKQIKSSDADPVPTALRISDSEREKEEEEKKNRKKQKKS
jgi:hypothetical protein